MQLFPLPLGLFVISLFPQRPTGIVSLLERSPFQIPCPSLIDPICPRSRHPESQISPLWGHEPSVLDRCTGVTFKYHAQSISILFVPGPCTQKAKYPQCGHEPSILERCSLQIPCSSLLDPICPRSSSDSQISPLWGHEPQF